MAVRKIELLSGSFEGLAISIDGQVYAYVGTSEYVKKDGEVIELLAWSSRCRTCDAEFESKSSRDITYQTRRCISCRPKRDGS